MRTVEVGHPLVLPARRSRGVADAWYARLGGAVAFTVLLLASSAIGARQFDVRTTVPLPAPASAFATGFGLSSDDRGTILLDVIRRLFDVPEGGAQQDAALRTRLNELLSSGSSPADSAPLPLNPAIWRSTLLPQQVPEQEVIRAILSDRASALLYHGLAALDDETLEWIGGDRETLLHVREHPGAFAVFGRSIRVRRGRIIAPGGADADPIWRAIVGEEPTRPGPFVRRLFRADRGRLAFFYDTLAHLDAPRLKFALAGSLKDSRRADRANALAAVFRNFAREWDIEARPFTRPQIDPSLTLSTIAVTADGDPIGPTSRALWDFVFRSGDIDAPFATITSLPRGADDDTPLDAAWLASRIHLVAYNTSRRRLDMLLFGQRVLAGARTDPHEIATVLRAFAAWPALLLTLERTGVHDVRTLLAAARQADALNEIAETERRRGAIMQFQATLGLIDRAVRSRGLSHEEAGRLIGSLTALPVSSGGGFAGRLAEWIRSPLLTFALALEATEPLENGLLMLIAGAHNRSAAPVIEWEGRRYRVDYPAAELSRLRRIRERQGGPSLDVAIQGALAVRAVSGRGRDQAERTLGETLTSLLYAAHLGQPEGPALSAGNAALRHDLDVSSVLTRVRAAAAWRPPVEIFGQRGGWRVSGSLLGLDVALRRLSLRRLDPSRLPPGPRLPLLDRQTLMLTVALVNPHALTDEGRDAIAAALAQGRARVEALGRNRADLDAVAREAGLSEWRREAVRWTLTHLPDQAASQFSLLELFWLGAPAGGNDRFDAWGGAMMPLTGCLCLAMPQARPWEELAGRRASGVLGTRGIDVTLHIAETLSRLKLPASLAAGVLSFAMQDVVDDAQAGYFNDWGAFGRAASALSQDRIVDYIAALTANGPLVPVGPSGPDETTGELYAFSDSTPGLHDCFGGLGDRCADSTSAASRASRRLPDR